MKSRCIYAAAALSLLVVALQPARAQQQTTGRPDGKSTIAVASANILAGALTAGVRALLTDGDVPHAALLGALGGSVNFVGKRIVAEPGAGPLLGRVVHAAGTSIVVQAGVRGAGVLDSIQLPLGPLALHISRHRGLDVSINAYDLYVTASAFIAHDDLELDWPRTLRALTPVFTTDKRIRYEDDFTDGATVSRVIVLSRFESHLDAVFAHELVHVLQRDFELIAWDRPVERAVRRRVPGVNRVPDWVHAGVLIPLALGLDRAAFDKRGYYSITQAEAEWFERWHQ